jgi:ATP-dependent DNA helicase DinG
VLQGRNNYVCRRRLAVAVDADEKASGADILAKWSESTRTGLRSELPEGVSSNAWEQVLSDTDLTLRKRCSHFDSCFFYEARRSLEDAHILVVNHALLLVDLQMKHETGRGLLPDFDRLIIDEAHHLEDAATGVSTERVTALALRRLVSSIKGGGRGAPSPLQLLVRAHESGSPLSDDNQLKLMGLAGNVEELLNELAVVAQTTLGVLAEELLGASQSVRFDAAYRQTPAWQDVVLPDLIRLWSAIDAGRGALLALTELFDEPAELTNEQLSPVLELKRAGRRLGGHATVLGGMVSPNDPTTCRWAQRANARGPATAALCAAPIEVAGRLQQILWQGVTGVVCTSATLATAGNFVPWRQRHGLGEADELTLPSPFDFAKQALLGLPRDLPPPDAPGWIERVCEVVGAAVQISGGGTFVLCTSYATVTSIAAALRSTLGAELPVYAQGEGGRALLLERFKAEPKATLVATDAFWEGVSVRGQGLRQVIIPRLPFRVPTDPLRAARYEAVKRSGRDPFRALALPAAALKLKQGVGRLIRSKDDRGVILLLDRRLHDRSYGRVLLASLPPARRVTGPWRHVSRALRQAFRDGA